jgi:hypothetical protein
MAALIARGLSQQDSCNLDRKMRLQALKARRWTVEGAVVQFVALGPGIEDRWTDAGPQKAEEPVKYVR